jgi:hypothetical protein
MAIPNYTASHAYRRGAHRSDLRIRKAFPAAAAYRRHTHAAAGGRVRARTQGNDVVRFNIETKISPLHPERTVAPDVFARALIAAIARDGLAARTVIQLFDWRTLVARKVSGLAI